MCKVMQLYGMTANEALRLSDSQVTLMLDHAQNVAEDMVRSDPGFQTALGQRLAPVKRAVRAEIDT